MKTYIRKTALAVLFSLLCPIISFAAFGEGSVSTKSEVSIEAPVKVIPGTETGQGQEQPSDSEVYIFDGKKYIIDYSWGKHYLTGYSPNEDGTSGTASGKNAAAGYTVSSTRENLGRVVLIKAVNGSSRYDGVYKCEDTGGEAVENGKANTMDVPVVDIFFNTREEAYAVTDEGWITAEIFILKEVK